LISEGHCGKLALGVDVLNVVRVVLGVVLNVVRVVLGVVLNVVRVVLGVVDIIKDRRTP